MLDLYFVKDPHSSFACPPLGKADNNLALLSSLYTIIVHPVTKKTENVALSVALRNSAGVL